jgi:16S rRNA (guanine527-N7)-methyltransferase
VRVSRREPELVRIENPEDFRAAFQVSRETLDRLELYEALLRRWQKAVNLVAPSTLGAVWQRHFADSAQLVGLVPAQARSLADLGSGAGFPGLVMALILAESRPMQIWLIEADQRKAAFLKDVVRQTGIAVDILSTRIEDHETQARVGPVDVVTARALAPFDALLELSMPFFGAQTVGLFPRGRGAQNEVAAATGLRKRRVRLMPSRVQAGANIAVVAAAITANAAAKTNSTGGRK